MDNRVALTEIVTIDFYFQDNSVIRSRCTANKRIVESFGMVYRGEGLYDLDVKKKIPEKFLEGKTVVYREGSEVPDRKYIDVFLEPFLKNLW